MSNSKSAMGKRSRDVEDEVYFDNYHTHKRYLTEVMASSMNGLKVCESVVSGTRQSPPLGDPMVSPAQTDTCGTGGVSRSASSFPSHGDETSTLDSPMSDDSDESVGYRMSRGLEIIQYPLIPASEQVFCSSNILCTPRRLQRASSVSSGYLGPGSSAWMPTKLPSTPYTPSAWPRCLDADGKLPSSPSDPCQSADLRRAALLRTLQLRSQFQVPQSSPMATMDNESSAEKLEEVQETVEEGGDQSSPSPHTCHCFEHAEEHVECNRAVLGSPNHGLFVGPIVRGGGAPPVRSLHLGDTQVRTNGAPSGDPSPSTKLLEENFSSRFEEDTLYTRSPRSPRRAKAGANSSGYEVSSSFSVKDGNDSDTESSLVPRRSASRTTSLSRQPSVCSHVGSSGRSLIFTVKAAPSASRTK